MFLFGKDKIEMKNDIQEIQNKLNICISLCDESLKTIKEMLSDHEKRIQTLEKKDLEKQMAILDLEKMHNEIKKILYSERCGVNND